ncbi:hypothetical protein SADUNF_Sadunf19G0110300 [Salix dunnii]|uniref:Receptor-like serine/threonine-protein kinase n=1 Tax=Salix dunnii TaxID=1413687 RepID=A0A835MCY2_9ROSI|nr:hypothetical protein SADUNF_Sadunf19G0110300 [Salix dunnii]
MHSWLMARRGLNQRDLLAMLSTVLFSYAFFLCCFARDTITYPSGSIGNDGQETLVSAGKRFELGFFTPEESTVLRSYIGIWYYRSNPRIVVWVANRNSPLVDVGAGFAITDDGNLQILHRNGTSYWSTDLESTSKPAYREAKLLDSGNLVFGDSNNTLLTTILWQSFAYPTDTFLSGMNMSENLKLISWESRADPKEGNFTFQLDEGSCNLYNMLACRCLPGFKPASPESWRNGDFSGGCSRSSAVCGKNDTFLRLKMMRVGQQENKFAVESETKCREECLNNCPCQAYSFVKGGVNKRRNRQPSINMCLIWTDVLKDLQEEYSYGEPDLFVRVAIADTALKAKSCEPCGINVIPYPLSTGSDCGDPMYFSFHCDNSTGKLSFKTQNGTYNVTTIDQDTFAIEDKDVDHCNSSTRGQLPEFNLSFPFKMNACDTVAGNFGSNISSQGLVEIVIGWEPPPEPVCTSPADCEDWPNSTCKNVTGNGKMRCHCNSNFRWDGMALNCVQVVDGKSGGTSRKKKPLSLIVGITIASVIVLSSIFLYTCILMRKKAKRRESQKKTERNAALMYGTEKRVKNFIDAEELNEEDKKGIDVPFFDLDSILAATDYFSEENKLGRGGFGPVYKAWRFWRENKALDLMDETLHESCNTNEFLRCLNAALLCVQEDPTDRPTMSNVVVMLSSEIANLPVPKEPAFFIQRGFSGTASTSSKQERGLSGTTLSSSKQETSIDTAVASDEGQ